MSIEFYYVAVVATLILSAGRITRLLVADVFPPIKYLRDKYGDATDGSDWSLLAYCGYCMSFWVALVLTLWAALAGVFTDPVTRADHSSLAWWLVNGVLAVSYAAAMVVARDGDDS